MNIENKKNIKNIKNMIEDETKGLILDMDGTILDSMWVWEEIDREFLGKRGFNVPEDYVDAIAPLGSIATAKYTIERFGLSDTVEELTEEWFDMALSKYQHQVELKPFVKEFIIKMKKKGKKIGLATSSDIELVEAVMDRTELSAYFDTIVTASQVKRGKGFPDIYEKAAINMQLVSDECVVFEDILAGIKGAKAGNFKTVGVYEKRNRHEHEKIKQSADGFIMGFEELL